MNATDLQAELVKDLLIESFEGLDRFDRELLLVEQRQHGPDTLNSIFRVIHTIKGTAGCLGLHRIERVAHVGENLLALLRDGQLMPSPELTSGLFAFADALRALLRCLEQTSAEGDADHSALLARLEALAVSPAPAPVADVSPAPAPAPPAPDNWGLFDDAPPASVPQPTSTAPVKTAVSEAPAPETAAARSSVADTAVRVDVAQLDRLMNLVGELVLARNQMIQHITASRNATLLTVSQRLSHITTELQEGVMKTRMQPIGSVWTKFPRVVRDVAHELGKDVRLDMQGKETELDRTLIEAIKDPLTHVIRNAIDHGLEAPEVRTAAGKPAQGQLLLRAFHEGGQVNIEVRDDGAGINLDRVRAKAVEKGLLTAENAAKLTERESLELIFLPGLSTAAKLSNISGRGVGMDVVKTNIERVGGSVDVQSQVGTGTALRIKIPLTLAIIPALLVTSGGQRFAIPQVSLLELVRLEPGSGTGTIESVFNSLVYRLRGQLLPVVCLNRVLGLGADDAPLAERSGNLVVLQADGRQFGLVVDEVNDTEEIVVKPLGKQLKHLEAFAGATIMGDGQVALILDVMGLAQHAALVAETRTKPRSSSASHASTQAGTRQTLLLFSAGGRARLAVPLGDAARLEEFALAKVEQAGGRSVVQYRGHILPLVHVARHLGASANPAADPLQVVVFSEAARSVGLVVDQIHDIVEETVVVEPSATDCGILGSAVVQGRVTDLLDVRGVVRAAEPGFFAAAA
ncbi:MAG: histidine kinase [Pedosphaera sp. Tous-C6FEB]|nr:MAG: histidine kinase [Pedosphaera sp. Tous-C6FEB]